jgi:hypothetical protein
MAGTEEPVRSFKDEMAALTISSYLGCSGTGFVLGGAMVNG